MQQVLAIEKEREMDYLKDYGTDGHLTGRDHLFAFSWCMHDLKFLLSFAFQSVYSWFQMEEASLMSEFCQGL